MASRDSLGEVFRVSIFGESHGPGVGALVTGAPPGLEVDEEYINRELERRRPGGPYASPRREADRVEILSGVFRGRTTGAPILLFIRNVDVKPGFYEEFRYKPRPGHADYVAYERYLGHQDYRGGGVFSGRRTAALVAAGAIAKLVLSKYGVRVYAYVKSIGGVEARVEPRDSEEFRRAIDSDPLKCPDPEASERMRRLVEEARREGDSLGSVVEAAAFNVPPGLGDPPLGGVDSLLARAVIAIPAAKAIEFGDGFALARMRGSEAHDSPRAAGGRIVHESNRSGGIVGGLTNGMPIVFRVAFKPPSSIPKPRRTVDLRSLQDTLVSGRGRHDPVIGPRAAPVVEAVTAIVLADLLLLREALLPGWVEDLRPWRRGVSGGED
ncbi:chorismate synthase [Aeropyrum camini]|uniref:Chorismate synthase n=1 Tax=Aeropyrum camini SY1 = JCM 12091 TaxID=1198449 RepID=U3TCZ1_9CREN|nr:chorismate synthase [Aeropyrum camini]BAN89900.1 chorismate synthase [Aeropyrum camini SY1 = JCM 12091]